MSDEYIDLTLEITPEDGQYTALCLELGVASCGDTVEEAVATHMAALEELGERERFLRERGVLLKKPVALRCSPELRPEVLLTAHRVPA